ncbi:MAG: HAD-superfamily hydrolase, subfamily variant 1 [Acidobacteriaceae bacterium]|nr:HAD-superfamily hydrolase, subfamily variant 1 [Acidobacteriaceae bacterium]
MPATKWIDADAYLFDIDGTLLNAYGGAHYNAFHSALKRSFNLDCKIDGVPLHGNTDIGILRAVLAREGLNNGELEAKLSETLEHMCDEVEKNRGQLLATVCPGIVELMGSLRAKKKLLGVASGNLERIGWMKVEAANLREYFSFGAFADGHEKREDIFRNGVAEVRSRLGPDATVCVVGDTPSDINAAKSVGIPVIAVATGIYTLEQLTEHAPDLCVKSCTELLIPYHPAQ